MFLRMSRLRFYIPRGDIRATIGICLRACAIMAAIEGTIMRNYVGLFLLSLTTLMYEILLTRIFSVTMLYHFAFFAISVGMFGMTVGAMIVYLAPQYFTEQNTPARLANISLLFGISIAVTLILYLNMMDFFQTSQTDRTNVMLLISYLLAGIPFTFSGMAICLALTKLANPIGKLYAADLIGAAMGCILLLKLLDHIDAASAMLCIAVLGCLAGFFFKNETTHHFKKILTACIVFLSIMTCSNVVLSAHNDSFIRIGEKFPVPANSRIYEKWNSFSRILIHGYPFSFVRPFAWGLSSTWPEQNKIKELILTIDAYADTPLMRFTGNLEELEFLRHDITNAAHIIKNNANVFIVGLGGGRDALSALLFHQNNIVGVEINDQIISALTHQFGNYTGHLDRYPNVHIVNDEARSYLGRLKEKFDIIQISLVDTFAATSSGAFVFSENSLYTLEAWKTFMEHLNPDGVISVSYWYGGAEMYRFLSLAVTTLKNLGVKDCQNNIIVMRNESFAAGGRIPGEVATILISKSAFTEDALNKLDLFAKINKFNILVSPRVRLDALAEIIILAKNPSAEVNRNQLDLAPPTDNTPFFFFPLKPQDIFKFHYTGNNLGREGYAIHILQYLLIEIFLLCVFCIFIPLYLKFKNIPFRKISHLLIYFSCIGLGFMFIELSQMERLIIFLGHPTYGLSVVLFTLLLSSGIGSLCAPAATPHGISNRQLLCLSAIPITLLLFGYLVSMLIPSFRDAILQLRIALSIIILFPIGFFMGMAFPIGMLLAKKTYPALLPWFWGVNGAASVLASVLAVAVSLTLGISATLMTGFAFYCIAVMTFFISSFQLRR